MTLHVIDRIAVEDEGEGDAVVCVHGLGGSSQHLDAADAGAGAAPRRSASTCRAARARSASRGRSRSSATSRRCSIGLRPAERRRARTGSAIRWAPSSASTSRWRSPKLVRSIALFGPLIAPPDAGRTAIRRAPPRRARRHGRHARDRARPAQRRDLRRHAPALAAGRRLRAREPDAPGRRRLCAQLRSAGRARRPRRSSASRRRCCWSPATRTASRRRRRCARWPTGCTRARSTRVVVLPRCGHWTPIERPDECQRELRDFLADQR